MNTSPSTFSVQRRVCEYGITKQIELLTCVAERTNHIGQYLCSREQLVGLDFMRDEGIEISDVIALRANSSRTHYVRRKDSDFSKMWRLKTHADQ